MSDINQALIIGISLSVEVGVESQKLWKNAFQKRQDQIGSPSILEIFSTAMAWTGGIVMPDVSLPEGASGECSVFQKSGSGK